METKKMVNYDNTPGAGSKPSFLSRLLKSETAEERKLRELEEKRYHLLFQTNEIRRQIGGISKEIQLNTAERSRLVRLGEEDASIRDDILTELKGIEAAIQRLESQRHLLRQTSELYQKQLTNVEDELNFHRGIIPTAEELEVIKKDLARSGIIDDILKQKITEIQNLTSEGVTGRMRLREIHEDTYSQEVRRHWAESDARKGITAPSKSEQIREEISKPVISRF